MKQVSSHNQQPQLSAHGPAPPSNRQTRQTARGQAKAAKPATGSGSSAVVIMLARITPAPTKQSTAMLAAARRVVLPSKEPAMDFETCSPFDAQKFIKLAVNVSKTPKQTGVQAKPVSAASKPAASNNSAMRPASAHAPSSAQTSQPNKFIGPLTKAEHACVSAAAIAIASKAPASASKPPLAVTSAKCSVSAQAMRRKQQQAKQQTLLAKQHAHHLPNHRKDPLCVQAGWCALSPFDSSFALVVAMPKSAALAAAATSKDGRQQTGGKQPTCKPHGKQLSQRRREALAAKRAMNQLREQARKMHLTLKRPTHQDMVPQTQSGSRPVQQTSSQQAEWSWSFPRYSPMSALTPQAPPQFFAQQPMDVRAKPFVPATARSMTSR